MISYKALLVPLAADGGKVSAQLGPFPGSTRFLGNFLGVFMQREVCT
jgi:hypothetical protein